MCARAKDLVTRLCGFGCIPISTKRGAAPHIIEDNIVKNHVGPYAIHGVI